MFLILKQSSQVIHKILRFYNSSGKNGDLSEWKINWIMKV